MLLRSPFLIMKIFNYLVLTLLLGVTNSTIIKVVSTPKSGEMGPEPCITQCMGSTGENTPWEGGATYVDSYFDIAACGFTAGTTPMVIASLHGTVSYIAGNPAVSLDSGTRYEVVAAELERYKSANMLQDARTYKWRADWVATGYTC